MKASLRTHAAPVLLLAALAGGIGATAFAQTTPAANPPAANPPAASAPAATPSGGTATPAPSGGTTAAPSAAAAPHHATTTHKRRVVSHAPVTMEQMAEQRIADLHARLKITAAEQSQWDQFAQVMRDNAKDLDQAYQQRAANFDKMNAIENMQSYEQIEQLRAQGMQKLVPAFQTVYSALSDQQKMQADQLFRNRAERAAQHRAKTAH